MTGVAGLGSAAPAAGPKAAGGSAAKTPADGRSAFAALVSAAGQKGGGKASKPPSGHAATPATAADPALATGLLALAQAATQSAPTSSAAVSASLGDAATPARLMSQTVPIADVAGSAGQGGPAPPPSSDVAAQAAPGAGRDAAAAASAAGASGTRLGSGAATAAVVTTAVTAITPSTTSSEVMPPVEAAAPLSSAALAGATLPSAALPDAPAPTEPARGGASSLPAAPGGSPQATASDAGRQGGASSGRGDGSPSGQESGKGHGLLSGHAAEATASSVATTGGAVVAMEGGPAAGTATQQVLDLLGTAGLGRVATTSTADPEAATAPQGLAGPDATPRSTASPGTLTLELNPANLGRVTVTLQMRGDALDVHIAVDSKATLTALDRDRRQLENAIGSVGGTLDLAYAPATSVIPPAPRASDPGTREPSGPAGGSAGQGEGGAGRGTGSSSAETTPDGQRGPASPAAPVRRDGSLYL